MNRIISIVSGLLLILVAGSGLSHANESQIRELLERRDRQIKEILGPEETEVSGEQMEVLRDLVNEMIDYREMVRFALHETYSELSTAEQEEFTELFAKIIRDQSLNQLELYRAEMIYDDIARVNNEVLVKTTAVLDDKRVPIYYRLRETRGEWHIVDLAVDDAWTAESYRRSFQNIIRRRGFEALLESLRRRAADA